MSAKKARREGSSESNRTGFHEWGAASRENFAVGFIRVYLLILGSNVQRLGRAAGRGGPQRSKGGEIPAVTGSRYSHGMFEISEL